MGLGEQYPKVLCLDALTDLIPSSQSRPHQHSHVSLSPRTGWSPAYQPHHICTKKNRAAFRLLQGNASYRQRHKFVNTPGQTSVTHYCSLFWPHGEAFVIHCLLCRLNGLCPRPFNGLLPLCSSVNHLISPTTCLHCSFSPSPAKKRVSGEWVIMPVSTTSHAAIFPLLHIDSICAYLFSYFTS